HQRHFFLVYSLLAQLYAPEVVEALQCNLQLSMEEVEKSQALRVEWLLGTSQQKKTQQTLLSMSWQRQRCSELPHLFRYLWRTGIDVDDSPRGTGITQDGVILSQHEIGFFSPYLRRENAPWHPFMQ